MNGHHFCGGAALLVKRGGFFFGLGGWAVRGGSYGADVAAARRVPSPPSVKRATDRRGKKDGAEARVCRGILRVSGFGS